MILQIVNNIQGHYEIIESIIVKHQIIIGKYNITKINLMVNDWDKSFKIYIKKKYPHIQFKLSPIFNFYIDCTVYPKQVERIKLYDPKKYFFISHDIDMFIKQLPNVFFLTPLAKRFLYADVMPHMTKKNMNKTYPIYVVQGHFGGSHSKRRNLDLLLKILEHDFKKKYLIKFVGRGEIPEEFKKHKNRIKFIQDLDFNNYHQQFNDCYAMFSLTLKETNPQYYKTKLTSTINYIRGYKLKGIIDEELQNIYKLPDVQTYTSKNDIVHAFTITLNDFYINYVFKNKNQQDANQQETNQQDANKQDANQQEIKD